MITERIIKNRLPDVVLTNGEEKNIPSEKRMVKACNGRDNAAQTYLENINTENITLQERDLTQEFSIKQNEAKNEEIVQDAQFTFEAALAKYLQCQLNELLCFVKEYIYANYELSISPTLTDAKQVLKEIVKLKSVIMSSIKAREQYPKFFLKLELRLEKELGSMNCDASIKHDIVWSSTIHDIFFKEYYKPGHIEYRREISKWDFSGNTQFPRTVSVKYESLRKMLETTLEGYFRLFKEILNSNESIYERGKFFLDNIGESNLLNNDMINLKINDENRMLAISKRVSHIINLQFVIDAVLYAEKTIPTEEGLNKIRILLKKCLSNLNYDAEYFRKMALKSQNILFVSDYRKVLKNLNELLKLCKTACDYAIASIVCPEAMKDVDQKFLDAAKSQQEQEEKKCVPSKIQQVLAEQAERRKASNDQKSSIHCKSNIFLESVESLLRSKQNSEQRY